MTLKSKVAIITGAVDGIGAAIANELNKEQVKLVINSVKSTEKGKHFANELDDAIYIQANVAKENDCIKIVDAAIEKWGRLDILINNASAPFKGVPYENLSDATDDIFKENFEINLMGAWYLCRAALPYLKKSGDGNIINMSSIGGSRVGGNSIPYSLSKAALEHLTRFLAKVSGPEVRVNAVAPGLIHTPRTTALDIYHEAMKTVAALQRSGEAEEIAQAVIGLIKCRYVTGQVLIVDGGIL